MDTTTVLEIIKMLDKRIDNADMHFKANENMSIREREYFRGKLDAYDELSNHLQKYIEAQLNAAELSTGE